MAETDWGALTNLQKKVWSAQVWHQARVNSFFIANGMMGEGIRDYSSVIHLVDELSETVRGIECVMPMVPDLIGDGVVGDNQLEGNEEALTAYDLSLTVDQLRHGVRNKGRMSEQRTVIRWRLTSRNALAYWMSDRLDQLAFLTVAGIAFTKQSDGSNRIAGSQWPLLNFAAQVTAPSTNRKYFAGPATSTATLTDADTISWNRIVEARAELKRHRVKGLKSGGKDRYILLLHPYQMRDLKLDPDYRAACAQGGDRGKGNSLFTGAVMDVDGFVIYEHERTPNTLGLASGSRWGATGTVHGAQALVLGAQALGMASITDSEWGESTNTDYGNKDATSYGRIFGLRKPIWMAPTTNTVEDYGVVSVYTASKPTS